MKRSGVKDYPLVSVLIGTRNRVELLIRCLKSVLSQNYPKLEILVLDDCSEKHNVCGIISDKLKDGRLRCFRSNLKLGVAGGRNFLIKKAFGKIMITIDDDAVFNDNECISLAVDHLAHAPQTGALAFKIINHERGCEDLLIPFSRYSRKRRPELEKETRFVSYYLGGGHALCREAINRCGLYQDNLMFGGEELDLSYKLINEGFSIVYVPDIVVHHFPAPSVSQSVTGEPEKGELYFSVRNIIWIAHKYLPFPFIVTYLLIRIGYSGATALKDRQLGEFFRGIGAALCMVRKLERCVLRKNAVKYVRANFGRLWY